MPCYACEGNRIAPLASARGEWRVTQTEGSTLLATIRGRTLRIAGLLAFALATPQLAQAQFSETYKFLDSVRKSDNTAVVKALEQPGVTPVNTKDRSTGETALMITIARRDLVWSNYLLAHGARHDMTDNEGRSPLMIAVERRFYEGAQLLLAKKANANQGNGSGETPLMRAVQNNDVEMVRLLIDAGADPNRRDTLAGMSAIDYAKQGNRAPGIVDLLNSKAKARPAKGVQGPQL